MRSSVVAALMVMAETAAAVPCFAQVPEDLIPKSDEAERNGDFRNLAPVGLAPDQDAADVALRTVRNRLHNTERPQPPDCVGGSSQPASHPSARRAENDGCTATPTLTLEQLPEEFSTVHVDLPPLPDLPVRFSDTVLVGVVNRLQPHLSEDRTNIYTEYTITITAVLRNKNGLAMNPGSTIALDRMGGAIRLSPSRVIFQRVEGEGAPLIVGHRYVLFLRYDTRGSWFRSVKSWELRNGVVLPVDPGDIAVAQRGQSRFAGTDEPDFISAVRDAVQRVSGQ
ncbi:MAG: hypothetical protein LC130_26970 [Bryobacterales bacterium]|nr:hypothetical protein [Bryobacterales bacterium]